MQAVDCDGSLNSQLCHFLATVCHVLARVNVSILLGLYVFICEIGIMVLMSWEFYENHQQNMQNT